MPTTALLSAPSSDVVWTLIAGSALYRSNDRGDSWEQRPLPTQNISPRAGISFVDDQQGWLSTGGSPQTQCNGEGTAIWHMTEGGSTWQRVADVNGLQPDPTGIGYAQCKEGLSFIDATHGFLAAWDDNHPPTIYRTSDGGHSWSGSTLPDPPGFVSQPAGFELTAGLVESFGVTLLVPAWGMQEGAQIEAEYVFRSTNGGATWTYLAKADLGSNNVTFVTASRWLQLIEPDQSVETTDSGKSWHPYSSDYAQAAPVAPEIVFGGPLVGYATVRGQIQRTTDGGLHWSYITTPGTK